MTQPRILVLYYTQTGQTRDLIDHVVQDMKDKATIEYAAIEPVKPFPFPWPTHDFFDAMPETVQHITIDMKPLPDNIVNGQYDLVIFGYQPWFLNPSQPITSFLMSPSAKVLSGKPVVTVIGARNMFLHAQEKVKEYLLKLDAKLVGNIIFKDTNPNLISLLTVIRWTINGQKERSKYLPPAGVQEKEVKQGIKYGMPIYNHLTAGTLDTLQDELISLGAADMNPGLVLLEQQGIKNFRFWSKYIREKGGPGDPNRKSRVTKFKRLLLLGIFVLSPITSMLAKIRLRMNKAKIMNDVRYFKQTKYEQGRI